MGQGEGANYGESHGRAIFLILLSGKWLDGIGLVGLIGGGGNIILVRAGMRGRAVL